MRLFISAALIALNLAVLHAAPQNGVVVESKDTEVAVVGERLKGDNSDLFAGFQNDDAMVKTCLNGVSCEFMTVADAKALEAGAIESVESVKGETEVTRALTPTLVTMSESLRSLQAQKVLLENLEASMNALRSRSMKGQELSKAANTQFADSMTKGIQFSAESKGQMAPALPSKGLASMALPPSKGSSYSMSSEAMLCPMTMFELGKCQKVGLEMKVQKDSANAMSAQLMAEKQRLENALAASELMRKNAEEQAAFNAKYAAEQKARADMFENGFNQCTVEKAMVKAQKETVEAELAQTQSDLADERQTNAELTATLAECNDDKAALTVALDEQTARAEAAEEELAATKARLEEEIDRAIGLEESLSFTQNRLSRCEADLKTERTAREETEEELMKTMTDLSSCQNEVRVTTEMLSRTRDELQETIAALARESAARQMLQEKLDTTVEQLRATEQELRDTRRALENEQNAHATTQRILAETREELEATEAARQALEEAKQKLEDELALTKDQLDSMTAERDQLQASLESTSAALAQCTADKMQCEANYAEQKAISDELAKQLTDAMMLLKAEKEAREQLTATILLVEQTSLSIQEEVNKLQIENIELQKRVEKLQAEQGVALALAAGCPPTYEKFGSSCYKYVREKTQWKMAQEQCMKDSGNLVAIESTQEQIFVTNYLKRHGASDAYTYTSGNKQYNGWKWLGASDNHIGASGAEFWYNMMTKAKPGYDCQAMYMYDPSSYGKWVGLPCHSSAPYVCEYRLLPHGSAAPNNAAEQMAILKMAEEAPAYLTSIVRQ